MASLVVSMALVLAAPATAATVSNGAFETGDLSGWTTFTTGNGAIGSPTVTSFDTTGTGASNAARFQVGEVAFEKKQEGGGLYQSFSAPAGTHNVSADVATDLTDTTTNADCGTFELLVDGLIVAQHAFGRCDSLVRAHLSGSVTFATSGTHELQILMRRAFQSSTTTPYQFLDNVSVNRAPTLNASGGQATYAEDGPATAIDPGLTASDPDSTEFSGATVRITGNYNGAQDVLAVAAQNGISGSYDNGTGTLSLTGSAAVADYQAALRSVEYHNTSGDPSTATRTVSFQATDTASDTSNTPTRDITITPVNDAPELATTNASLGYTENGPAAAIDPGLTAADVDDANLDGARVRISSGLQSGDELMFAAQNGITGSYDTGTGALTLTGTASVLQYQAALRSVEYRHTGENPSASKTVEFRASDGDINSNTPTRDITVTPVNDAPTAADDAKTVAEDAGATTIDVLDNDSDVDGGANEVAAIAQPAHGTAAITNGGANVGYKPDVDHCATAPDKFAYTLNGGSQATVSVTVTCVDDAPRAAGDAKTVGQDSGATAFDVLANDSDVDGGAKTISATAQPANGTVQKIDGDTQLSYQPNAGYCNSRDGASADAFTYTLNGGSEATVNVTVDCRLAPPEPQPQPAPQPSARVLITHRNVHTNKRGALVRLHCAPGVACTGTVELQATSLSSRLEPARISGPRTTFALAAGSDRNMRVAVASASRKRLAARGKAVARVIVRLGDGTVVKRLVTLYPAR
jgi:hypothetical protein